MKIFKNEGIINDCKVYLCGYEKNVDIADVILKREYSHLPEAEKYFNSHKKGTMGNEELLLIKINKNNELFIEEGYAKEPKTLISLNTNKLKSEEKILFKELILMK